MKFFGSGNTAFGLLGKHYKKTLEKELKKQRKDATTLAQRLIQDFYTPTDKKIQQEIKKRIEKPKFSKWEKRVVSQFKKEGIRNSIKFRKFPLKISETLTITYIPDFLLLDYEKDKKDIVVEAHEYITQDAIAKNSAFMRNYKNVFELIMVVPDRDLRAWNDADKENKLFHDIWTMNNVKFLIDDIKRKYKKVKTETECPTCHKKASGYKQIYHRFGFRKKSDGSEYPQSLCIDCRGRASKIGTKKLKQELLELEEEPDFKIQRFCTCCNKTFLARKIKSRFCENCLKEFND